jgi:Putative Ig domain
MLLALGVLMWSALAPAQNSPPAEPLSIATTTLPRADLRHRYFSMLEAKGGTAPLTWEVSGGALPPGIELSPDGLLSGISTRLGDYQFLVTVTDSGKPKQRRSKELTLRVITPLLAEWSHPPHIEGQRIEGMVKVSNESERDFTLTFIAVAINQIQRATALGYQHFNLQHDTEDLEIPFGENLPPGTYTVNVDVIAEAPETNTVYKVQLQSQPLQIVPRP